MCTYTYLFQKQHLAMLSTRTENSTLHHSWERGMRLRNAVAQFLGQKPCPTTWPIISKLVCNGMAKIIMQRMWSRICKKFEDLKKKYDIPPIQKVPKSITVHASKLGRHHYRDLIIRGLEMTDPKSQGAQRVVFSPFLGLPPAQTIQVETCAWRTDKNRLMKMIYASLPPQRWKILPVEHDGSFNVRHFIKLDSQWFELSARTDFVVTPTKRNSEGSSTEFDPETAVTCSLNITHATSTILVESESGTGTFNNGMAHHQLQMQLFVTAKALKKQCLCGVLISKKGELAVYVYQTNRKFLKVDFRTHFDVPLTVHHLAFICDWLLQHKISHNSSV